MEKLGYTFLAIAAFAYLAIILWVTTIEIFPWGLIGLSALIGVGFLLIKVLSDRSKNAEDDHYDKNVHE